jgi:hypothetical protein
LSAIQQFLEQARQPANRSRAVQGLIVHPFLLIGIAFIAALAALWIGWQVRRERTLPGHREASFGAGLQAAGVANSKTGRETATQLTAPVCSEVGAFLEVISGDEILLGKMLPLYLGSRTTAGRSLEQAELIFNLHRHHSVVSRLHCEFDELNGIFRVRDLGSSQGTFVNGMRLPAGGEGQVLLAGDQVELGPSERGGVLLRFHSAAIRLVRPMRT